MLTYTNYLPAVPRVSAPERISTANAWPSDETVMAYARAAFAYSCRPARPFPAAPYRKVTLLPVEKPIRVSTEQLPAMTLATWREEQQDWQAYQHAPADVPAPKPPRKLARVHAFLDKLIAWRQSLGKQDESWLR